MLLILLASALELKKPFVMEERPSVPGVNRMSEPSLCRLNGESMRGRFKICSYDCGTGRTSVTVDERIACPLVK